MKASVSGSLLLRGPQRVGLSAAISGFFAEYELAITKREEFIDDEHGFSRTQWTMDDRWGTEAEFEDEFSAIAEQWELIYSVRFNNRKQTVGILSSNESGGLIELLNKHDLDYFPNLEFSFLLSDNEALQAIADRHAIPFFLLNAKEDPLVFEEKKLDIINRYQPEYLSLVGYKHALSANLLANLTCPVIDTHLSWLPHDVNVDSYTSAYEMGVKVIGVLAKIITANVSGGLIVEQEVARVGVGLTRDELSKLGLSLEHAALVRALLMLSNNKTLIYKNRTINFS